MKRKIALLAAVAICLSILAYGSVAYFHAEGTAHNVITTCGVEISIDEQYDPSGDGNPVKNEDGSLTFTDVLPGMTIKKEPKITNEGQPAWIRVKIEKYWDDPENKGLDPDVIKPNINEQDWLTNEDDPNDHWLYYNKVVEQYGEISPFETVTFDPKMGNEYQEQTGHIIIKVQAVQSVHNPEDETKGVLAALGWPEEVE